MWQRYYTYFANRINPFNPTVFISTRLQTLVRLTEETINNISLEIINSFKLKITKQELVKLYNIFQREARSVFGSILPIRELAFYFLERFYYLKDLCDLYFLRTLIFDRVRNAIPAKSLMPDVLNPYIERTINAYYADWSIELGTLNSIFTNATSFLNFFLQLASPNNRYSELTYGFIYERTPKFDTLQKLVDRANFVITLPVEGTDYMWLVYDTTREENILQQLPFQFLKPKIAMFITEFPVHSDINFPGFEPEFLFIAGRHYSSPDETSRSAYFVPFVSNNFTYLYDDTRDDPIFMYEVSY